MSKYTVVTFVRTYDTKGKMQYWGPGGDVEVDADTLDKAVELATAQVKKSYEQAGIKLGDFLVDHVLEEDGNHIQLMAWDESGFPAF